MKMTQLKYTYKIEPNQIKKSPISENLDCELVLQVSVKPIKLAMLAFLYCFSFENGSSYQSP